MAAVSSGIHAELDSTGPAGLTGGENQRRRAPVLSFPLVHEEVQQKFDQYVDSLARRDQVPTDEVERSPNLQLVFTGKMPDLIYTKSKIRTTDQEPLQVKLIDATTGDIVVPPPSAPLKVEIFVLEGDFPAAGRNRREDNWTSEDFKRNLLKRRTGKPPLLVGERTAWLVQGLASFEGLEFTDNSRWRPSGKFTLGVTALPAAAGSCQGPRIREAITKPFKVLERRGESCKKHDPPRPNDEVWRLKQIAKDGPFHKKLNEANIRTVQDFLRLLRVDRDRLIGILGKSEKTWKITIEHAKTCRVKGDLEYAHQEGQTSNMGYRTSTLEELIPQQMLEMEVQEGEPKGAMGNGNSVEQAISMPMQGGTLTWPPNYQQQNSNIMPAYDPLGTGTGIYLNNMQTNSSFEEMDFAPMIWLSPLQDPN